MKKTSDWIKPHERKFNLIRQRENFVLVNY